MWGIGSLRLEVIVNKTNLLAKKALAKAKEMGWEARCQYDQSDVLDWSTVVAWEPGASQARYITFIEGTEARKGWVPLKDIEQKLERSDCY